MPNRPPSAFSMGQCVRIRAQSNGSPRVVTVRDIRWHFQNERYYYDLEADGKNLTGRFSQDELEAVALLLAPNGELGALATGVLPLTPVAIAPGSRKRNSRR